MDLALTPDLEQLIDEQLTRGRLRTPKEVMREALLLLKERTGPEDADRLVDRIKSLLPVCDPLIDGADTLAKVLLRRLDRQRKKTA